MRPCNPTVIAVVDPRIHGVMEDGVCMKLGKSDWVTVEAT